MSYPQHKILPSKTARWCRVLVVFLVIFSGVGGGLLITNPQTAYADIPVDPQSSYDIDTHQLIAPPGTVDTGGTNPTPTDTAAQTGGGAAFSCVSGNLYQSALCVLVRWILNAIFSITSFAVTLTGKLLDGSMYFTAHMKDLVDATKIVDVGWSIFRDFANLVFIFVLLYIAIATILNVGNTRKMLVDVIITALLINFSLFFTKVIVDASNMVALMFYDKIVTISANSTDVGDRYPGPSKVLANVLRYQTTYTYDTQGSSASSGSSAFLNYIPAVAAVNLAKSAITGSLVSDLADIGKAIQITFFGAVIMLIIAFVFATGALLLCIRIIVLMFLMILSPLAFVARILPRTQTAWNKWWDTLLNNAIFAPVYLAFMYLVLQAIVVSLQGAGQALQPIGSFSDLARGRVLENLGVIFNYIFCIILLVGVIFVSKSISVYGGSAVQGWAKGIGNWTRGKVRQAGGYAVSKTAGAAARRLEEKARGSTLARSWLGTRVRELTTKPLATTRFGGAVSAVERKKEAKERLTEYEDAKNLSLVRTMADDLKNTKAGAPGALKSGATDAEKEEHKKRVDDHNELVKEKAARLQDAMLRVSGSGLARIATKDYEATPELAKFMTPAQFQAVYASDEKTQEEKDRMVLLRNQHIEDSFGQYREAEHKANVIIQQNPGLAKVYRDSGGLDLFVKDNSELSAQQKDLRAYLQGKGVVWSEEAKRDFDRAHDEVRGRSVKELGMINRANPELINSVAPSLNWWQVKGMRTSDDFTYDQREGKGGSLRDYKESTALTGTDLIMGVDLSQSFEERYKDRDEINKTWQKVIRRGENSLTTAEEKVWSNFKKYVEANGELVEHGLAMIETHQRGRSPEELTFPGGRVRNIPAIAAHYQGGVVKPMMQKDNIHHEVITAQMLREYADGKLTEGNKAFLSKILFDREGKDFYSEWKKLAKQMKIATEDYTDAAGTVVKAHPEMEKLAKWFDAGDKKAFDETVKFVPVIETIPGYKKPTASATPPPATPPPATPPPATPPPATPPTP